LKSRILLGMAFSPKSRRWGARSTPRGARPRRKCKFLKQPPRSAAP